MKLHDITQSEAQALTITADEPFATTTTPNPVAPADRQFTIKRTIELIRDFLSAEKPEAIGPAEIAIVVTLITAGAMDHPVFHSHQKLAEMIGCDARTIRRAEKTLKRLGYIVQDSRRGLTKLTMVVPEKLPTSHGAQSQPTDDAKELAGRYIAAVNTEFPAMRNKRRKTWTQSQIWNAQKILGRCGGDMDLACRMIGHALGSTLHKHAASMGLYKLHGRWASVKKSYAAKVAAREQAQQTIAATQVTEEQFTEGEE